MKMFYLDTIVYSVLFFCIDCVGLDVHVLIAYLL